MPIINTRLAFPKHETSVTSSAAIEEAQVFAADTSVKSRLRRLAFAASILVPTIIAVDLSENPRFGLDAQVNCAAVNAHRENLDPYFVKNLKDTDLSYPYLPVTLDAFRPLCAGGFLVAHYNAIYLILGIICILLLPTLGGARASSRDVIVRGIFALAGFLGFEWVMASGNFAMLSGLMTAASLALLLRPTRYRARDAFGFISPVAGAALLGFVTSFKLVFCPVLAALYFLPLPRRHKLMLIAVAGSMFALPMLISAAFYTELCSSWFSAISGQIPGQHSPVGEDNPSLLFLAQTLAGAFSLAGSRAAIAALYVMIIAAFVLGPLAVSVWRIVGAQTGAASPLQALDGWLLSHPEAAMRVTALAMFGLYLCAPRLKVYAFFEAALYVAVLIVDLPAGLLKIVLALAIAIPFVTSVSGFAVVDGLDLLTVALVCFWILSARVSSMPKVMQAARA